MLTSGACLQRSRWPERPVPVTGRSRFRAVDFGRCAVQLTCGGSFRRVASFALAALPAVCASTVPCTGMHRRGLSWTRWARLGGQRQRESSVSRSRRGGTARASFWATRMVRMGRGSGSVSSSSACWIGRSGQSCDPSDHRVPKEGTARPSGGWDCTTPLWSVSMGSVTVFGGSSWWPKHPASGDGGGRVKGRHPRRDGLERAPRPLTSLSNRGGGVQADHVGRGLAGQALCQARRRF